MGRPRKIPMLGDAVESALGKVGITTDKVEAWLGRACRCRERKRRLNALSAWANRIIAGETGKAEEYLSSLMNEDD